MSKRTCVLMLLLVCLVLTLGTSLFFVPMAKDVLILEADEAIMAAGRLLQQMDLEDQEQLLQRMTELSNQASFREVFEENPSSQQGQDDWLKRLRESVETLAAGVEATWPVKDFFLLDRTGLGIVRKGDSSWFGDPPDNSPIVLKAIQQAAGGDGSSLMVRKDQELVRAVAVPVIAQEQVSAVLFAVFPINDAFVKRRSQRLHEKLVGTSDGEEESPKLEIGYVSPRGIAGRSFTQDTVQALEEYLDTNRDVVSGLLEGKTLQPSIVEQASIPLMVTGVPLLSRGGDGSAGIILARSIESIHEPVSSLAIFVVVFGLLVFMFAAYAVIFFGQRLDKVVSRYEFLGKKTLAAKGWRLTGSTRTTLEHRLRSKLSDRTGSQAARQKMVSESPREPDLTSNRDALIARQPHVDNDGQQAFPSNPLLDEGLDEIDVSVELEIPPKDMPPRRHTSRPSPSMQQAAPTGPQGRSDSQAFNQVSRSLQRKAPNEPEDSSRRSQQHYREVYREFLRAKESVGERIEKLNFERFVNKLKKQEALIKSRQGCHRVDFEVIVKNNQVSLRPRIVR